MLFLFDVFSWDVLQRVIMVQNCVRDIYPRSQSTVYIYGVSILRTQLKISINHTEIQIRN